MSLPTIITGLQKAIADAQSLLTTPTPTPVPTPTPASTFRQYLLTDDGAFGPSRRRVNEELWCDWPAYRANVASTYYGNWVDAAGMPQGSVAFATLSLGPTTPIGRYVDVDITSLVAKWLSTGKNRGAYLRSEASTTFTAFATIEGRTGANPPKLAVVTDTGAFTLTGTLAGFDVSTNKGTDTRLSAKLKKGFIGLLHFPDLGTITGTLQSATARLWLDAVGTASVLTLQFMETDYPYMPVAGDGAAPVLGLAAQVGEDNLSSHPDVIQAGDFAKEKWFSYTDSGGYLKADGAHPTALGGDNAMPTEVAIPGIEYSFEDDPQYPGRKQFRGSMSHGLGRTVDTGSVSLKNRFIRPIATDPRFPVDPNTIETHLFVRARLMLEADFFSEADGIKGGIGFDMRLGFWKPANGGYWQETTGNSGSKGTGLKIVTSDARAAPGQFEYQGHSSRQHQDFCHRSGTPYQNHRPLLVMISHNGPFDYTDKIGGIPYGTEELRRCGYSLIPKGAFVCVEWEMQLNSIDLSSPDALGNGTANHDGVMRCWLDGRFAWEKTDFAWRRHPEFGIEGAWLMFMSGGTTPVDAANKPHFRFADFVVARRYIGPRG